MLFTPYSIRAEAAGAESFGPLCSEWLRSLRTGPDGSFERHSSFSSSSLDLPQEARRAVEASPLSPKRLRLLAVATAALRDYHASAVACLQAMATSQEDPIMARLAPAAHRPSLACPLHAALPLAVRTGAVQCPSPSLASAFAACAHASRACAAECLLSGVEDVPAEVDPLRFNIHHPGANFPSCSRRPASQVRPERTLLSRCSAMQTLRAPLDP